jgi:hypothetical protein
MVVQMNVALVAIRLADAGIKEMPEHRLQHRSRRFQSGLACMPSRNGPADEHAADWREQRRHAVRIAPRIRLAMSHKRCGRTATPCDAADARGHV